MPLFQAIEKRLENHLAAAPTRLLRAAFSAADNKPSAQNPVLNLDQGKVLEALAKAEGQPITGEVLRKRIELINTAAQNLAKEQGEAPILTMRSAKRHLVITLQGDLLAALGQDETESHVLLSTEADTHLPKDKLQTPRARLEGSQVCRQVFVSHAWEDEEVEAILDSFLKKLGVKLKNLPEQYRHLGPIDLWIDREKMNPLSEIGLQTDEACKSSQFALFILNDKWHLSKDSQREAAFFTDPATKKPRPNEVIQIQLSGTPALGQVPVMPALWKAKYPTLLALWDGTTNEKDQFATLIRDQICEGLASRPEPPEPTDPGEGDKNPTPKPLGLDQSKLLEAQSRCVQPPHARKGSLPGVAPEEDANPGSESFELLPMLHDWATSDAAPNRIFALLGSFGAGKTTAVQLFAQDLDERRKRREKVPFPVYLDFRRLQDAYDGSLSLNDIILKSLRPEHSRQISAEQLLETLRQRPCVVIFDGLDEIGTRIGVERAGALYRQMVEIIPSAILQKERERGSVDWNACPTRLLVTCRTHFFRDHMQQTGTLHGHDRQSPLPGKGGREGEVRTLFMAPFTPEQIKSFFVQTLGEAAGGRAFEVISKVHDLTGLASKPIMTRYIADMTEKLEEDAAAGRKINVATVYQHLFRRTLERDGGKQTQMTARDREALLEKLALHLWRGGKPSIAADDLEDWFDGAAQERPGLKALLGTPDNRMMLHTELRNASLLVREGNDFRFVHTSFFEYFLAGALVRALEEGGFATLPLGEEPSRETFDFIADIADTRRIWPALTGHLHGVLTGGAGAAQRALAVKMLARAFTRDKGQALPEGADLSALDLRDAPINGLLGRTPEGMKFAGANLLGKYLNEISFIRCDFEGTNLANVNFDRCYFTECTGTPQGLAASRARLARGSEPFLQENGLFRFWHFDADTPQQAQENPPRLVKGCGITSFAALSPDGARALIVGRSSVVYLWDIETAQPLRAFAGHKGTVACGNFSLDGKHIVTGSGDGLARIWNIESGDVARELAGHSGSIASASFSPNGKAILTAGGDHTARLWDRETGETTRTFPIEKSRFSYAAFLPDGASVMTWGWGDTVRLWDVATGQLRHNLESAQHGVISADCAPDGKTILAVGWGSNGQLWDIASGHVTSLASLTPARASSVAFTGDGTTALLAGIDGNLDLVEVKAERKLRSVKHLLSFAGPRISHSGTRFLLRDASGIASCWDMESWQCRRELGNLDINVMDAVFLPDCEGFMMAGQGRILWRWKPGFDQPQDLAIQDMGSFRAIEFSADGARAITSNWDGIAHLWDFAERKKIHTFDNHQGHINSLVISSNGEVVLSGQNSGKVFLWSAKTGEEKLLVEGLKERFVHLGLAPDATKAIISGHDSGTELWDLRTGQPIAKLKRAGNDVIHTLISAFSPKSETVLTSGRDNHAYLWNAGTGQLLKTFEGHEGSIDCLSFTPDGARIATGSEDCTARLWDVETGAQLRVLEGHEGRVTTVTFSPDGKTLFTAAQDGSFRLWDVETGAVLRVVHLRPDAWLETGPGGEVIRMSEHGWKYLYGTREQPDALPLPVCPDLPEIVFDAAGQA